MFALPLWIMLLAYAANMMSLACAWLMGQGNLVTLPTSARKSRREILKAGFVGKSHAQAARRYWVSHLRATCKSKTVPAISDPSGKTQIRIVTSCTVVARKQQLEKGKDRLFSKVYCNSCNKLAMSRLVMRRELTVNGHRLRVGVQGPRHNLSHPPRKSGTNG